MTQLDKRRIGFKPEHGQNQWTRREVLRIQFDQSIYVQFCVYYKILLCVCVERIP